VAVPLILIVAVSVTVVTSIVVCQIKRASKKITEKTSNIYADPLQDLEVNEAYETHVILKNNVAYATNMELKHEAVDFRDENNASPPNLDVERDETYASTTNLLDPVQSAAAYATVAELEPYAAVTAVTKGNREEYGECVTRAEEQGENESYGSAIVTEKNEASKPESSNGTVDEYAGYHTYDSI
jgi:hypothetical protein